jgi:hypothetical protein
MSFNVRNTDGAYFQRFVARSYNVWKTSERRYGAPLRVPMTTFVAEIPELVRAHRKDQDHIEELSAAVSQLVRDTFGARIWIRHYREIAVVAELVYYAATTLSGSCAVLFLLCT